MSKEKNLVYVGPEKRPAINGRHCDVYEFRDPDRYNYECHVAGPAIDRLYEFEKLAMEPEEIKGRLEAADDYRKEIVALERDNNKLRDSLARKSNEYCNKITAMSRDLDNLEEENSRLKSEIKSWDILVKSKIEAIANLDKINGDLRNMNQRQYDNIAELQKEIDEDNLYINGLEIDNNKLRNDINRRDRVIDGQNAYIRELNEKIKELNHRCDVYMSRNATQTETVAEYRKRNEALEERIKALEEDCEYFKGERNDAFEEIRKIKIGQVGMRDANATMKLEKEKLEADVKKLEKLLDRKQEKLYDKNLMIDKLMKENKTLKETVEFWIDQYRRVMSK